jgi:hypothetical protein
MISLTYRLFRNVSLDCQIFVDFPDFISLLIFNLLCCTQSHMPVTQDVGYPGKYQVFLKIMCFVVVGQNAMHMNHMGSIPRSLQLKLMQEITH